MEHVYSNNAVKTNSSNLERCVLLNTNGRTRIDLSYRPRSVVTVPGGCDVTHVTLSLHCFLCPSIAQIYPTTFSNRVWLSLLLTCRKYIQWYIYLRTITTDWVSFLIHEVSRSHPSTHHSRYDSSGRVISQTQRHLPDNSQQTDIHALGGIRTRNPRTRATADQRLTPRSHWDRRLPTPATCTKFCPPVFAATHRQYLVFIQIIHKTSGMPVRN